MQGNAASDCCTRAGEGLWSQLGDPASILLLNAMRTHISLRRNPAANQRNPRNLWLICSENSEQTWRLEHIYTWTKLSVLNKERSQKVCRICPHPACMSALEAQTLNCLSVILFVFFLGFAGIVRVRRWVYRSSGPSDGSAGSGRLCVHRDPVSDWNSSSQAVTWYQVIKLCHNVDTHTHTQTVSVRVHIHVCIPQICRPSVVFWISDKPGLIMYFGRNSFKSLEFSCVYLCACVYLCYL